jgi:hypothetical protein
MKEAALSHAGIHVGISIELIEKNQPCKPFVTHLQTVFKGYKLNGYLNRLQTYKNIYKWRRVEPYV